MVDFRRREQAQMALGQGAFPIPGQVAPPGDAAIRQAVPAEGGVVIATHPVSQGGGNGGAAPRPFPVVFQAPGQGAEGTGHGRRIQHQQHG